MERPTLISPHRARDLSATFGTPLYIYDFASLRMHAQAALRFPNAFGLTVRYAMKAAPNAAILHIFDAEGLHFDAGSGYEVERALKAGISPAKICLSTQEMPANFAELIAQGIQFNACSLHQIERFGKTFPNSVLGLRFNPGLGSGSTAKTNVGGPASSFGIWNAAIDEAKSLLEKHRLRAARVHTHIGSGSDPSIWERAARLSLDLARHLPNVTTLNLGGGFKIARMATETAANLDAIGSSVRSAFIALAAETGRHLHLEIEPGAYLVANAGAVLAKVQDTTTTGPEGFTFLKLDAGMTEILRPSLYGAQHPITIIHQACNTATARRTEPSVVVGHCCESGDLLTPAPNDAETLAPRTLNHARIGDLCVIGGAGAYCSAMAAKNYNSFPEAAEVLLDETGTPHLIRKRQTLDQIIQNEIAYPLP